MPQKLWEEVGKFYHDKMEEQAKEIIFLKQRIVQLEEKISLLHSPNQEASAEAATYPHVKVIQCAEVEQQLYNSTWMKNAIENEEVVLFKNMSKSNGINHNTFWRNLNIQGK